MKNSSVLITNILIIFLVVVVHHVIAQLNTDCTTPNSEKAKCIQVTQCTVILNAVKTKNATATKFAQDSHCGYDKNVPLVCCGTKAFPDKDSLEDIFGIFNKNQEKEKQDLEQVILTNFQTKELPDRTVCGLEREENRIWGGEETELDEFPWMAALEYVKKKDKSYVGVRCGGSLINNRYVLTAAHCLVHREFELSNVRLGEWDISKDPDCHELEGVANIECADNVVKVDISESIAHPYYSKRTGNNDIGLLKLARDVPYTNFIRPICLPPVNLPAPPFMAPMTVAGWGITENNTASDIKLKVDVPLLANDKCREKIEGKPIGANQLCAGGELGKDSCQGDSGGPLMRTYEDALTKQKQWYQEGVVSQGLGCARFDFPAIYTRVSRYIIWIIQNISTEED